MNGREINRVICSCGGEPAEVDTSEQEEKDHGCRRRRRCCVKAWECPACKTRWTFSLAAPEADYRD